ncbi:PREDICTED: uncharacterized protein LOC106806764 [Priapulus caudatus]|uniref:Uncharacterized protein LOC106806764 n=1 Tax=Priapulus caudatus TaxID=37621 RepID=A0ABM1DWJ0_PRICU|nr:PREDICTED: uncharacterized protein LOC106806764 [Priapulus caudatus]
MFSIDKILHFLNTFLFVGNFLVLMMTSTCTSYWVYVGYDVERVVARAQSLETVRVAVPVDTDTYVVVDAITCKDATRRPDTTRSRQQIACGASAIASDTPSRDDENRRGGRRKRRSRQRRPTDNAPTQADPAAVIQRNSSSTASSSLRGPFTGGDINATSHRDMTRLQLAAADVYERPPPSSASSTSRADKPRASGRRRTSPARSPCAAADDDNDGVSATTTRSGCDTVARYIVYERYSNLYQECDNLEGTVRERLGLQQARGRCVNFIFDPEVRTRGGVTNFSNYDNASDNSTSPAIAAIDLSAFLCGIAAVTFMMIGVGLGVLASFIGRANIMLKGCQFTFIAGLLQATTLGLFHIKLAIISRQRREVLRVNRPTWDPVRIILEEERTVGFGWSFVLAWICVALCLLAAWLWLQKYWKLEQQRRPVQRLHSRVAYGQIERSCPTTPELDSNPAPRGAQRTAVPASVEMAAASSAHARTPRAETRAERTLTCVTQSSETLLDRSPRELSLDRSPRELLLDRSPRELSLDRSPRELSLDRSPRELLLQRSPRESLLEQSPRKVLPERSPREKLMLDGSPREDLPLRRNPKEHLLLDRSPREELLLRRSAMEPGSSGVTNSRTAGVTTARSREFAPGMLMSTV